MKKISKAVILAALFVIISIAVLAFVILNSQNINVNDGAVDVGSDLVAERAYNVLVLGTDREAGLTDVMMLVRLDLSGKSAFVMQIPRDTYANYTDGTYKKINGAYSALGARGLCDFVSDAMGISVDRYVVLGLDTVRDAIDAIGGVDVNVPFDMKYSDKSQGLHIDLKAGNQHLDGNMAEQFLRFRSGYIEGDIDRMDAQKIFLAAVAKKVRDDFSLPMMYRLLSAVDGVETDFKRSELLSIAIEMASVKDERISVVTLPGAEARASVSGASYYSVSQKAASELVEKIFGADRNRFDTDRVFLNDKSSSFRNIYNGYTDYKAYSLADIDQNGIEIDLK